MKNYVPFHPALPDPTPYFEAQGRKSKRDLLLRAAAGCTLLVSVGVVFYFFGVALFSSMQY